MESFGSSEATSPTPGVAPLGINEETIEEMVKMNVRRTNYDDQHQSQKVAHPSKEAQVLAAFLVTFMLTGVKQ